MKELLNYQNGSFDQAHSFPRAPQCSSKCNRLTITSYNHVNLGRSSSQDSRVQVGSSTCFEAMTLQSLPIVRNIERYLSGKGFAFRYLLYGCFDYSHHFKIFFYQTDKGTLIFKVTRSGHKMQLNGRPYF